MVTEKKPKLEDYIAGAALANSLAWLTLGIMTFSEINPQTFAWLSPIVYAVGAVVAGYLVSRKATQNQVKVGFKVGLGAFVFHVYIFVGVFELLWGSRVLFLSDHLLIFAIFILGAPFGSFLCKQFSSTNTSTKSVS
jgi:hypothetical protein